MQVWTEIRRRVLVEKVPKRQICQEYQISHHTLEKMLQNVEPTGYPHSARASVLDPSSEHSSE